VTSPSQRPVEYKGEPLDSERGPGLGCFRFQVVVLVALIILTPLTVAWQWPTWISVFLLSLVIVLLLVAGQTIIFLLRLVAADRRTRRRPLGGATKTVGEIEDEATATEAAATGDAVSATTDGATTTDGVTAPEEAGAPPSDAPPSAAPEPPSDEDPVRQ
jgi:hypothetical protein